MTEDPRPNTGQQRRQLHVAVLAMPDEHQPVDESAYWSSVLGGAYTVCTQVIMVST